LSAKIRQKALQSGLGTHEQAAEKTGALLLNVYLHPSNYDAQA
jgi:hypothetical protein